MKKLGIAVFWIACGIHNWGFTLGDFSHRFPDQINTDVAGFYALVGPCGIPAVLLATGDRHWLLKPLTTEQRWEAFHKRFPDLGRDDFEQDYD